MTDYQHRILFLLFASSGAAISTSWIINRRNSVKVPKDRPVQPDKRHILRLLQSQTALDTVELIQARVMLQS